ncbi:T9SS type A sorting domain-containing protein [Mesonia aquimarina]|uniref:T9SS type A sorting domain-containing protein n=1 Tax=Mesonia aquimarina TaxID=1504967 RepID=UPI0013CF35AA|nr:T9SS type A sorting domain-containing protein [Mesonia aquimarina]
MSSSTPYDVYVRSICSSSESNWVGPFSFTTLAEPCLDPSNLTSSNITENSADLTWTENGTADEWEIEYGLSGFTLGNGTTVLDDDGTLGETISSLDQDTPYDYYVRSLCDVNESLWVGPSSFTTLFLGVEDRLFSNFSFYPNPVKNKIFVNNDQKIQQVEIFNLLGQLVFVEKPSSKSFILDLEMLKSDFYLLKVTQNDRQRVFSFIKE